MPYFLTTRDLACPVYFCQSSDQGFKLSVNKENATKLKDLEEALEEAQRLGDAFGMKIEIIQD